MELRQRYEEDLYLVRGALGWAALLAFALLLLLVPILAPRYFLYTAALIAAHVVIAVGLNLLVGYTGQISLGHAGFVALGAYTAGILAARHHLPWLPAFAAAGIVAALFGFLVGIPALRLTGPYLTIATLGFGIAVNQVLTNWDALSGGRGGLFLPKLSVAGLRLTDAQVYYLFTALAALLVWVAFNLVRSHIGRAFVAIRDSDIAAEVMGVNLTVYKTLAFAVSAFYAGIGGAMLAYLLGFLEPQMFTLFESIYYFSMIVVGGLGTIPGSILGAVLLTLLPQQLAGFKQYLPLIYGATIVFVMAVEPWGLYGRWLKIKLWFKTWPF
ncbi:MAG: branched-chain amino acid ABC transporter permease [Armatimonadota bacterium]|nr:branched-chain amino acid ABC transporter permease [Armatimonadota bacterium]MDR7450818.1 branched-chain amino acid ABC transporter permease [Armatimonadota bacterium]MDR7465739.1 branched-chain amino acid ABC transporter permease [Armatimonadota bacterium]MDR7493647.1 branched-chain amino acid ABC transporter permease [Armatimonadota bacterium]MDR7499104.1 branched-chain amino acid ABC transporter permease [Armatimonadota bacterium]